MENKSHAIAAGVFVLVVGAMLVALAAWLTRDAGERRLFELSSRDAVTGLQSQAAVRFRGVAVGKVVNIGFDPATPGNILVRIAVDASAPVTQSTFASLGYQGVTGLAFVQLDDGGESKEPLATDNSAPARIPMRTGLLATLSDRGAAILSQLEEGSRRANTLLQPDNQKALMGAIQNISKAAEGLNQLTGKAGDWMGSDPPTVKLPVLAKQASDTLQSMRETSERVGQSADSVNTSAAEFKAMNERLTEGGGGLDKFSQGADALVSAGRAINATTVPRLNRTVKQMGQTFDTVNDNPQSLLFGNGTSPPGPGEPGFVAPGGSR